MLIAVWIVSITINVTRARSNAGASPIVREAARMNTAARAKNSPAIRPITAAGSPARRRSDTIEPSDASQATPIVTSNTPNQPGS